MDIQIEQSGDAWVVSVAGKLDALSAGDYEKAVNQLLADGKTRLVINFAELSYISSAGLRVLLSTAKLLKRHVDALIPVFTTRFRRETRRLCPRAGVSILLMIDTGAVQLTAADGSMRQTPICELELELEHGQVTDLFALACELAQTLPLMPADVSKAERGYRLHLDMPLRPTHAEVSTLSADQGVVEAFRDRAYACVRQWQANVADALALAAAQPQPPEALAADLLRAELIHPLRIALITTASFNVVIIFANTDEQEVFVGQIVHELTNKGCFIKFIIPLFPLPQKGNGA